MTRVPVKPELFRWARERAGIAREDLAAKLISGEVRVKDAERLTGEAT